MPRAARALARRLRHSLSIAAEAASALAARFGARSGLPAARGRMTDAQLRVWLDVHAAASQRRPQK